MKQQKKRSLASLRFEFESYMFSWQYYSKELHDLSLGMAYPYYRKEIIQVLKLLVKNITKVAQEIDKRSTKRKS